MTQSESENEGSSLAAAELDAGLAGGDPVEHAPPVDDADRAVEPAVMSEPGRSDGWSLTALVPYDGREPPASASDELAQAVWCTVSAIWHPALLVQLRALPRIEPLESPTSPGPREIRILPTGAEDLLPSGYRTQAEDAGAVLIESGTSRDDLISRLRARLDAAILADGIEAPANDSNSADFLALGTAWWILRDLTTGMGHSQGVDRESLWRELAAGAHAWRIGDSPAAANRLRAAFEVLTQARERFYPVNAYLLDLCLLDPSMEHPVLAEPLAMPIPLTFIAPARAIEVQAASDPQGVAALRQAIAEGWADVAGGTYTEAEEPLLPLESILWQFARGNDAYRAQLDERSVETFARRRFGLFVQLPQVARRFGMRYAVHMAFDAGRFPMRPETKRLWEGPEGSNLETLLRPPIAGDRASHGWRLGWRLAVTMRDDHVAAVPVVRWPSPVAGWLADLRRVASYSPVLGRWTTLNDFFHLTDRPYETFRPDPDLYATPYLVQAAARRDPEPVSWLSRHRRLRARLDATLALQGFARAIASAASGAIASADLPVEDLSTATIEEHLELRRPDEATAGLQSALPSALTALARLIAGSSASPDASAAAPRGYLVINTLGLPRRVAVHLPEASPDLRPDGPLRAAQLTDEGVYGVVDLPPFGFAWVPAMTDLARPAAVAGALVARDRDLRNEAISITVDATTGGLRGVSGVNEPSPRLGQQLVVHGLVDESGKPVASQMRGDRFEIDFAGPALVQATSTGRILDPRDGRCLATFEQRYRLWAGRPILEVRVKLSDFDAHWQEHVMRSDPWSVYLGCRWAWPDANSMLRRTVLWTPEMTESDRPETPDALDITTRTQRSALLFGGLPYHRKQGVRMLDTLLIAGAETCRTFELGVVLDQEYPFHAAQDFVTPAVVVECPGAATGPGAAGWLARLDRQNVAISRVEFVENTGERGWGLAFHLLETSGQSGRCRLRLFRNPTWARQVDFLGETIVDLSVEGDGVQIDLTPHELARVEVTLA